MSNNLAYFRKKFKVTQEEIGCVINKSARTVCAKENGKIPLVQEEMAKITEFFKTKDESINVEAIFFTDIYTKLV